MRRFALTGAAFLSPAARAALVRRAFTDSSVLVRVQAVSAARAGSDAPDCAPIVGATHDASAYVQLAAIDALSCT